MIKHHLIIRNVETKDGRTTIKLESEYWRLIDEICKIERKSLNTIVQEIDDERGEEHPRTSALRVYVLKYFAFQYINTPTSNRLAHEPAHLSIRRTNP